MRPGVQSSWVDAGGRACWASPSWQAMLLLLLLLHLIYVSPTSRFKLACGGISGPDKGEASRRSTGLRKHTCISCSEPGFSWFWSGLGVMLPSRLFTAGPGAGLETPGPRSFVLMPLALGIDVPEAADGGPSLVGGAAPALSPLLFFPNRKDIVAQGGLSSFSALQRRSSLAGGQR